MRKDWTLKEVKFVEDNYETMTTKEIAKELGRSRRSIQNQAVTLGLKKKTGRPICEYALYDGENIIAQGTKKEIAEQTGLAINTISYYGAVTSKHRGYETRKTLVRVN